MIGFESPLILALLLPAALALALFARLQGRALAWIDAHVDSRFRRRLTVHSPATLKGHLALVALMTALLVGAAARPYLPGSTEAVAVAGRVLLLVDGSASMYAGDVAVVGEDGEALGNRMAVARKMARDLVSRLDGYEFALASFSGTGVTHLPMIRDRELLAEALRVLETHSYYRSTGSDLVAALDLVSHFVEPRTPDLQAVILGDGEMPRPGDYGPALAALAAQGVPIHAVGIGSSDGEARVIYNFSDIVAKKKEPRVLRRFTTRRDDTHLRRISAATGGHFVLASNGAPAELARAVTALQGRTRRVEDEAARRDVAWAPLALFLALFLVDALWIGRRRGDTTTRFELDALGGGVPRRPSARASGRRSAAALGGALATVTLLAAGSCGNEPRRLAHRENELGIARDAVRLHAAARPHYERSRGLDVEPHVPTHNLARSVSLAGDFSEAHRLFQEALELAPDLASAHYNDGVTLFRWGAAERDPRDCDLERTAELWQSARSRFAGASARSKPGTPVGDRARRNLRHALAELARVEALIAEPPEHCLSPAGGGGGGGGGDGGGEDPPQNGGGDEPEGGGASGGDPNQPPGDPRDPGADPGQPQDEPRDPGADPGDPGEDPNVDPDGDPGEDPSSEPDGDPGEDPEAEPDSDPGEDPNAEPDGDPGESPATAAPGDGSPAPQPDAAGAGQLGAAELEAVAAALERIAQQATEPGKFHRRTRPEQFLRDDWLNPDSIIWW